MKSGIQKRLLAHSRMQRLVVVFCGVEHFGVRLEVPMPEPTPEELAAEEKRRMKRKKDHEKYLRLKERRRKIAEGEIIPGQPYTLTCQCCGEPFQSMQPQAKFCKPACREKSYRQKAAGGSAPVKTAAGRLRQREAM